MPTIRSNTVQHLHCDFTVQNLDPTFQPLSDYQLCHLPYHLVCAEMEQELWEILKDSTFIDLQYKHTMSSSLCMDSFRQGFAFYTKNWHKDSSRCKHAQIVHKSISFLDAISDDLYDSIESFRHHQKN
ncbi:MAG: hypothetical protein CL916_13950, partial [Deltaproteobacteria bacterium]|nr:hypothetical protein [Deltaproteobacteria bacterium]